MKELVEARDIDFVWHFTRLANVPSILANGLIGRVQLTFAGTPFEFNDHYRLDGHQEAVCCSIAHPNYKMFYRLRQENPDVEWVVLALKPSLLWEKDCAFCTSNAASNEVTAVPLEDRKGEGAFNRLFEEVAGKAPRTTLGISDACPTNPQAEILVFGNIETNYIVGAVTQNKETEAALAAQHPNYQFKYYKALFSPRKDYEHWK